MCSLNSFYGLDESVYIATVYNLITEPALVNLMAVREKSDQPYALQNLMPMELNAVHSFHATPDKYLHFIISTCHI
jgi:hypothetical protein